MGRINSRTKGNSFEIKVSKMIIAAYQEFDITEKDCYRTPSSGGHRYARKEDPGDLVISRKLRKFFPYHVEAKHYGSIQLWPLLIDVPEQKDAWKFKGWLEQLTIESKQTRLRPLLVFKGNGLMPILCAFPRWALDKEIHLPSNRIRFLYESKAWYVIKFDDFLRLLVRSFCE